jgi:hypothetical protein
LRLSVRRGGLSLVAVDVARDGKGHAPSEDQSADPDADPDCGIVAHFFINWGFFFLTWEKKNFV